MDFGAALLGLLYVAGTFLLEDDLLLPPASAGEEKRSREASAIEKTKEKGFEGVDFSFDLFGALPGQSATKMAEEVMAKDKADTSRKLWPARRSF